MNKIKDLFYNLNDVFVALAIIAVAGFIILWRVGVIMDYPAYAASLKKAAVTQAEVSFADMDLTPGEVNENLNANPENFDAQQPAEQQPETPEQPQEQQPETEAPEQGGSTVKQDTTFTIPAGSSCDKIGTLLEEKGLISSKSEFIKEVIAKKADTKIKSGDFKIPAGSTIDDIIAIITK